MTRPILITGATGFVGKHLVAAMQAAGDPLRCASRDPAGAARRRPDLDWVRLDIQDPASIRAAMEVWSASSTWEASRRRARRRRTSRAAWTPGPCFGRVRCRRSSFARA